MIDPATVTAAVVTTVVGFVLFVAGGVAHILSEWLEERDRTREQPLEDTTEVAEPESSQDSPAAQHQPT